MQIFRTVRFDDIAPLVTHMAQEHWDEVEAELHGAQSYTLDTAQYSMLEGLDMLHITAAWAAGENGEEQLCAYASFTITPCFHKNNERVATLDALYVAKQFRGGFAVLRLLREAEKALKERGAARVQYSSPVSRPCDALYKRLGARHTESIFHKEL